MADGAAALSVKTACPYCGVGCGVAAVFSHDGAQGRAVAVQHSHMGTGAHAKVLACGVGKHHHVTPAGHEHRRGLLAQHTAHGIL